MLKDEMAWVEEIARHIAKEEIKKAMAGHPDYKPEPIAEVVVEPLGEPLAPIEPIVEAPSEEEK